MPSRSVDLLTWQQIRTEVHSVNKELADIIDEISPDNSYKFVAAEYLYGDIPIDRGVAQIPTKYDELIPLTNPNALIDKQVQAELSYHKTPLFLILENSNEFFIDIGKRIIPINFFHKGWVSGIYEAMDYITGIASTYEWSFSSGARSVFMLPKITDSIGIKRLCAEYNLPTAFLVKDLSDHWQLFKYIAQSNKFSQPWKNKILYFGKKWLEASNDSLAWIKFKDYLVKNAWQQAQYAISKVKFSLQWGKFAEAITSKRLKPKLYILDQLKHILSIARGDYPAFIPVADQEVMPAHGLTNAFIDIYMLKHYFPTLMYATTSTNLQKNQSFYYSLSFPTLLEGSPMKKNSSTILLDLREIKTLIETLKDHLNLTTDHENKSIIYRTNFEYYHLDKDIFGEIQSSEKIVENDHHFLPKEQIGTDRVFCTTSPFFRGCIKITPNYIEK